MPFSYTNAQGEEKVIPTPATDAAQDPEILCYIAQKRAENAVKPDAPVNAMLLEEEISGIRYGVYRLKTIEQDGVKRLVIERAHQ